MNKKTKSTIGIIKWYASDKGFGVLSRVDSKEEVFLHHSNLLGYTAISSSAKPKVLVFEVAFSRNKISAKKCRPFNYSIEDFELLSELSFKINGQLYCADEKNKKIKITDLLDGKNLSFLKNATSILEIIKTTKLFRDILFIAINNNIQKIDKYIDFYITTAINKNNFIRESNELLVLISNSNIEYDIRKKFEHLIHTIDNQEITIEACKRDIICVNKQIFMEKYIDAIDLEIFKKLENEITEEVVEIFKNTTNQELIKYIIARFEDFHLNDYSIYWTIGVDRLSIFNEENQVIYLKKLFHLKHLNKIDFRANELAMFIDISILKQAFNNKTNIDFSTFLVIDLVTKYDTKQGFMATHELIKSVLYIIQYDKIRKVKIDKYFDKCNGIARERIASSDRDIIKERFTTKQGLEKYYFKIKFPDDNTIQNDIQNILGARYNAQENIWGVALKYEQEILTFGKNNNFLIKRGEKGVSYYEDNSHLLEIIKSEKEKPIGITYCCGQESQKRSFSGKRFWWCNQNQCFENNINQHENWQEYTLFDFMNILDLDLTEDSKDGNFTYIIGLYTRFVAFLNRFNRLLDRLYCNECNHVLYPLETSNFHKFSVTKFICKNENCAQSKQNNIVYLNHCLNGQCNAIIDSRCSKKCRNGLYICNECGSCCSHASFERRLKNLSINGGRQYERLYKLVQEKAGHLEKAEYYCYKCGEFMTEYSKTLYKCLTCNVEYDLSSYSHITKQQIHLKDRVKNYPNKSNHITTNLKNTLLKKKKELEQLGKTRNQIFGILFNKKVEIDGELFCLKDINNKELINEIFR